MAVIASERDNVTSLATQQRRATERQADLPCHQRDRLFAAAITPVPN
jgi:hypothetical protein